MSDSKKYYYLKLKENFFDTDEVIVLESEPDGIKYSNILMKMYLRSLKNDGKLMFNDKIPFNSTMLANVTRHSIGDVEKAVRKFHELGLIEILDNGAIYMLDIQNYVGKSSTEGDRKRDYRRKIENEKKLLDFGQMSGQTSDKQPPEIELEKEIEIEKDTKNKLRSDELKSDFELLWKDYPKKQGKDRAFKAYQKAIKDGVTNETIAQGISNYVEQISLKKTDPQYIKQGSTWFNNKCWEDEYEVSVNNSNSQYDGLF